MAEKLSRKSKTRLWFGIYFLVILSPVLFPPFLRRLNRAEPFVGPFPFIIFIIIVVSLLVCAGLFVLFEIEKRRGDLV